MTKKALVWFGVLLAVVFGITWATTRYCVMSMHGKSGAAQMKTGMSTWMPMVGLTDDQRKIIDPMEKKLNDDLRPVEMELANQRIALCRLLGQKEVAAKELDKTLRSIGELNMKQQEQVVHHLVSLKGILTPEQENKLFTSMMNDICQSCQATQGLNKDLCGMCGTMKK